MDRSGHTYIREVIYHFVCSECKCNWSYADSVMPNVDKFSSLYNTPKTLICPWCGKKDEVF
jgi:hypothetical protein